jgi:hypothetical protein
VIFDFVDSGDAMSPSLRESQIRSDGINYAQTVVEGIMSSMSLFTITHPDNTSFGKYMSLNNYFIDSIIDYYQETTTSLEAYIVASLYVAFSSSGDHGNKKEKLIEVYKKIFHVVRNERSTVYEPGIYTFMY